MPAREVDRLVKFGTAEPRVNERNVNRSSDVLRFSKAGITETQLKGDQRFVACAEFDVSYSVSRLH